MTTFEKACEGKVRFTSRAAAKGARKRMKGSGRAHASSGHLNPYPCMFCDFFHLGHMSPAVARGEVDKAEWRGESKQEA